MCGIYGWIGSPPDDPQNLKQTISRLLRHRGPDDDGFQMGDGWGLGFRRLSILDLSESGHQPMQTPDHRFWIVFNGEIYNYLELKNELEKEGDTFVGTSDTEVLLKILGQEGETGLKKLNGMFAVAMVDTKNRTFLLARDRLGQKPLYYHFQKGQLRFASELKGLLAWSDATRDINPTAISQFLGLGYLSSETSIFKNYFKLPPAHFMIGSLDEPHRVQIQPYWQLEITESRETVLLDELLDLLKDATRIRLRSDVPVGIFLSGGLDSGLVASLAGIVDSRVRPLALTVGFSEEAFDETKLAQETAKNANLEFRQIPLQPTNLTNIDRLAWFYDEPFGDASALPTFALCEAAKEHATVFLAGDGGDEAFAGYNRYIGTLKYQRLTKIPPSIATCLRYFANLFPPLSVFHYRVLKSTAPQFGFAAAYDGLPEDPLISFILSPELKPYFDDAGHPLWQRWKNYSHLSLTARQQGLDYALYLPDDILVKVDRASMAHSIEVRSPFLDHRVVEWAAALSRRVLLNGDEGKLPLRKLGQKLLPASVQKASKRGFGVPLVEWFRQPMGVGFLRDRLLSSEAKQRGFWQVDRVETIIQRHQSKKGRDFSPMLWRLLMLDAWSRLYYDSTDYRKGVL